jgi:hypothetical protein
VGERYYFGTYVEPFRLFTHKKEAVMLTAEKECQIAVEPERLGLSIEDMEVEDISELSDDEIRAKLEQLPEVEYPEAFLRELDKISEEAEADLVAGRIFPMTFEEFEAEVKRWRQAK